ncbi:hypothetical protein ABFX02_04G136800 [Erythranthe guttata]
MMPSRSTNGETSCGGNMQMNGHNLKRKSIKSTNCHQCHRNDKEKVVRCTKCKHRGYCILCINKWYGGLQEADFAKACAGCRKICNCTACLHSNQDKDFLMPDLKLDINKKIQYSKYIIRVLLPSIRKFVVEQSIEREIEARIHGNFNFCLEVLTFTCITLFVWKINLISFIFLLLIWILMSRHKTEES